MSHPRLEAHRNTYRRQAAGVRAQLAQAERAQLANPDLTDAQRRRNIRHLRGQAEGRLQQLAREYNDGKPDILRAIRRPLYKLPPQAMRDVSWRDAMDRASQVETQEQALMLWNRAALAEDEIQQIALAYVACPAPEEHPPRWPAIIAAWKRSDERVAATLADFDNVWQELQDKTVSYQDRTMFSLPSEQQPPDHDALPRLPQLGDGQAV